MFATRPPGSRSSKLMAASSSRAGGEKPGRCSRSSGWPRVRRGQGLTATPGSTLTPGSSRTESRSTSSRPAGTPTRRSRAGWGGGPAPPTPAAGGGAQTSGLPDFELSDLDDKRFKLSDALATDVVVLWFTNFCPGCQASFPKVNSIADRLAGHDVSFGAVSILGSDTSTPRAALSKTKLAARVLLAATREGGGGVTGARNPNPRPPNNP